MTTERETDCTSDQFTSICVELRYFTASPVSPKLIILQAFGGGHAHRGRTAVKHLCVSGKLRHCSCVCMSAAGHYAANFRLSFTVFMAANSSVGKWDVLCINPWNTVTGETD